ncbi:MAG: hypothetical protein CL790_03125 [Chloroflexi bacterium]|nr:hypothetical protein [Chloroflexota bacterium]HCU72213.1 hypothetical protein [Chloroflexota bacterium]|tara:strand:+ start:522 stop:1607 length:1086 start_codon:yes stop_codon:yes gene_type:complete
MQKITLDDPSTAQQRGGTNTGDTHTMAEPLKTVVVGAGRGRSHVQSIQRLPNLFELVAWVDLDAIRLNERISEAGLSTTLASTSLAKTLEHTDFDAIVVATWARTHNAIVGQAIDAQKHILVEKPYALTLATSRSLQDRATAAGLKVVVNQQWRYKPGQRAVRQLLAEQAYGQAQVGHLVTYKARGSEYPDSEHSQLWQMTVHEIDSVISMMGQPIIAVAGHSFRPPATTWVRESSATAELTFKNGARVVMVSTSDARVSGHEFRIECERGAIVYRNTQGFGGEESLLVGTDPSVGLTPMAFDNTKLTTSDIDAQVMEGWANWINGGPEPETSGPENLYVIGALDALLESTNSGRTAPVII